MPNYGDYAAAGHGLGHGVGHVRRVVTNEIVNLQPFWTLGTRRTGARVWLQCCWAWPGLWHWPSLSPCTWSSTASQTGFAGSTGQEKISSFFRTISIPNMSYNLSIPCMVQYIYSYSNDKHSFIFQLFISVFYILKHIVWIDLQPCCY